MPIRYNISKQETTFPPNSGNSWRRISVLICYRNKYVAMSAKFLIVILCLFPEQTFEDGLFPQNPPHSAIHYLSHYLQSASIRAIMSWLKHHPLSSRDTASQAGSDSDETNKSRDRSDTQSTYSNECASNHGYGTDDTLAVTRVLEQHGIPCCLVGIAALVFYGAGRLRDVSRPGSCISFSLVLCSATTNNYLSHVRRTGRFAFQRSSWARPQSYYSQNHTRRSID